MILELKPIGTPEERFTSRPWTVAWQTILEVELDPEDEFCVGTIAEA
jgi:hypothetical protein